MARSKSRGQRGTFGTTSVELRIRDSRLRLFGVALICAYVAFVPLVFDPGADWAFTVPKALLSHALAYALAGVTAGLLIRFGRDLVVWSWLHVPIALFLAVNVAASIAAEDHVLALYGTHARMLGLGTIAAWTMLYFAVVLLVRTRADVVALAAAGISAVVTMLGYELIQLLGRDPFVWNLDTASRPFSTNGQPTTLASYFTVIAVTSFAVALATEHIPRWMRGGLLVLAGALLAGAAATATRSAVVGLAIGSALFVGLVLLRHPSRQAKAIAGMAGIGAAIALAAVLTLTPIGGRLLQTVPAGGDAEAANSVRLDLASLDVRAVLYEAAVDVVRERPLLGYGPDSFVVGMTSHRPETGPDEARLAHATSPHSWVAQVATGSGLIGLGAFIAVIATALVLTVRGAFRVITAASIAAIVTYLGTGLTTVNDVGSDWVVWVGAAFIATSTAKVAMPTKAPGPKDRGVGREKGSRRTLPASSSRILLAALCVAVGIGAATTAVSALSASRAARSSETSRLVGQVSQSVNLGVSATESDPNRAEYWHRLGLAYVGGSRWRDAGKALERAVQLSPWDVRYVSDLIQTQLLLARDGDDIARARALQLAEEGIRRDPNFPDIHYTRAAVMQFTGNTAEAIRSMERAFALAPQSRNGAWYVTATQLYVAAGRPADAIRVALGGLGLVSSPSSATQLRLELARAYMAAGQPQNALAQVDAILAIEPSNVSAQRLRSEIQPVPPK